MLATTCFRGASIFCPTAYFGLGARNTRTICSSPVRNDQQDIAGKEWNRGSKPRRPKMSERAESIEAKIREDQISGITLHDSMKAWEEHNYERVEREWWKSGHRVTFWAHWRMKRDMSHRKCFEDIGPDRLRLNQVVNNNILPNSIKEVASEELKTHPFHKKWMWGVTPMCQFTSRLRGNVRAYNISRNLFKEFGDAGKISGLIRAKWG